MLLRVPSQPGFAVVGCPNCTAGSDGDQLIWNLSMGDQVQCRFCGMMFPNATYPNNQSISVRMPSGATTPVNFYQAPSGKKYWFDWRRFRAEREFMEQVAYCLAEYYATTGNQTAGIRAGKILKRFADYYPDYIIHTDLWTVIEKHFFENGYPSQAEINQYAQGDPWSATKWSNWAYMDISVPLLKAYDILKGAPTSILSAADRTYIETNLFYGMVNFISVNIGEQPFTNMTPTLWSSQVVAGHVLDNTTLTGSVLGIFSATLPDIFYYDGFWKETSCSYHYQAMSSMYDVIREDMPGLGDTALLAYVQNQYPDLARAHDVVDKMLLPNGRFVPCGDTWADSGRNELAASVPQLLPHMGYAILGMGSGANQFEVLLNFSGKYGHHHFDGLSLGLFAYGKELFSDIGYTYTNYRPWANSTTSHNTVTVNQESMYSDDPYNQVGNLMLFNAKDPTFQVVEATIPTAYYPTITTYKRFLAAVEYDTANGKRYVVDVFDVSGGGARHDYILHGSADDEQTLLITDGDGNEQNYTPGTLLPAGYTFAEPTDPNAYLYLIGDGPWAYGFFHGSSTSPTQSNDWRATFQTSQDGTNTGVRTWIIGSSNSRMSAGFSPSIRNTGEDNNKLWWYTRQDLILQRTGSSNRFIAVHCPFTAANCTITKVSRLTSDTSSIFLKIERPGGPDYFCLNDNSSAFHQTYDHSTLIKFKGRVAVAVRSGGYTLKMIDGLSFQVGSRTLTDTAPVTADLLAIDQNQYTVAGTSFIAEPGDTFIMTHGDGWNHGFHVATRTTSGGNTVVTTTEPRVYFETNPASSLTLRYYTKANHAAPHKVQQTRYKRSGTDLASVLANMDSKTPTDPYADVDGDGEVTSTDLSLLLYAMQ